jgi:hypothetical protein
VTSSHQIADLSILEPSIEDVIRRIYSGDGLLPGPPAEGR